MTPERLTYLRQKEVWDRAVFRRMAFVVPAIVATVVLFILVDIVGVPLQTTRATVQALHDT